MTEMWEFSAARWTSRWTLLMGTALAVCGSVQLAHAQNEINLGTVQATGAEEAGSTDPASAPYQAPTRAPLSAFQPTSIISQQYIQNNTPLSANYDNIVGIAPGVQTTGTNGAGLFSGKLAIRGFTDSQYNLTIDGIPVQFQNLFHRSTIYVMSRDLGEITLDRGPGTASTIGLATFGGTLALQIKQPASTRRVEPYLSGGSFNTQVYGAEFDTGQIADLNGGSYFLDAEHLNGDGWVTNGHTDRNNFLLKGEQPIGENTIVSVVGVQNNLNYTVENGATKAQIAKFGANYGMSNDQTLGNYSGYNNDHINSDLEYVDVHSLFDNWQVQNKVYSYAFFQNPTKLARDVSNQTQGTTYSPTDIAGAVYKADIRNYGDIFKGELDTFFGDVKAGVWIDHQIYRRRGQNVDFTLGGTPNPNNVSSVQYDMRGYMNTVQPYFGIDWKIVPEWTISPGFKYDFFNLGLNAPINQNTKAPLYAAKNYYSILPLMVTNYRLSDSWALYAQFAKGLLVPSPVNALYVAKPTLNALQPQVTWNYQAGTSWQSRSLTLSADAYYIRVENLLASTIIAGNRAFYSAGTAIYKGLEGEATWYVGSGVSLYGNGSVGSAKNTQTHLWVAEAPNATVAGGVIYNQDGIYASAIDKWVGSRYGLGGQAQGLQPFNELDLSLGYKLENAVSGLPAVSIKLEIENLLDSQKINDYAGSSGSGTPLYFTQAGRSFYLTVAMPISF